MISFELRKIAIELVPKVKVHGTTFWTKPLYLKLDYKVEHLHDLSKQFQNSRVGKILPGCTTGYDLGLRELGGGYTYEVHTRKPIVLFKSKEGIDELVYNSGVVGTPMQRVLSLDYISGFGLTSSIPKTIELSGFPNLVPYRQHKMPHSERIWIKVADIESIKLIDSLYHYDSDPDAKSNEVSHYTLSPQQPAISKGYTNWEEGTGEFRDVNDRRRQSPAWPIHNPPTKPVKLQDYAEKTMFEYTQQGQRFPDEWLGQMGTGWQERIYNLIERLESAGDDATLSRLIRRLNKVLHADLAKTVDNRPLKLYRGFRYRNFDRLREEFSTAIRIGTVIPMDTPNYTSWSTNYIIARDFIKDDQGGKITMGFVLERVFHPSEILCDTRRVYNGAPMYHLNQREVIIKPGKYNCRVLEVQSMEKDAEVLDD